MNHFLFRVRMRTTSIICVMAIGVLLFIVPAAMAEDALSPDESDQNILAYEQGQTTLLDSFSWTAHLEKIREERRDAISNIQFNAEFRTMYFDEDKSDGSASEAWAVGGSAGFQTGYFRNRMALGLTGYTSQKLYGPKDKDGTALLKPGQKSYSVLGELYGDLLISENVHAIVGRKEIDSPYINGNDSRMIPNTFETVLLQAVAGGGNDDPSFSCVAGYVDKIRARNSNDYVSMSSEAGATVDRGVYAGGGNFRQGGFSLGAIDYFSEDIINIVYTESKYSVLLPEKLTLNLSVQYTDQRSTGDDLLTGEEFSADQLGLKADLLAGGATFSIAYTDTGNGGDMQSPWSGYPGYTSVQVENFNRAGEDAFLMRAAYAFSRVKGLSVYALWVNGSNPEDPDEYARDEYDMNIQWRANNGILKGMTLRVRYAIVTHDESDVDDTEDLRLLCYYDFASWL